MSNIKVQLNSEIGKLNAVLLHRPGVEIERMTPENAHAALYSDILNQRIAAKEYDNFAGVLSKFTKTYFVTDLLAEILANSDVKQRLVKQSCNWDNCEFLADELCSMSAKDLAKILIEGFEYRKGVDPSKYESERYILKPLYNLFFTRDASSSMYEKVLLNSMSYKVRERETLIFKEIFEIYFGCETLMAKNWHPEARTEGGDVMIARDDVLFLGNGMRTNKKGIEFLVENFRTTRDKFNILYQELPSEPDSFIHLDMVFTFLGSNECMMYEPLIAKFSKYANFQTTHIQIENGKVTYHQKPNFLQGVKDLGFDMRPIICGGNDEWEQAREQWHSGANFFCMESGKILGYERNINTINALDKAGFNILNAEDICKGKVDMNDYKKFVAAFAGSELPRGGGGARCMTMPINRDAVVW